MLTHKMPSFRPALRQFRLWIGVILTVGALFGLVTHHALSAPTSDDKAAMQIIAQLNAWRIQEGLSPLKPNSTLRTMAIDQATYIVSLPDLPGGEDGGDVHLDSQGRTPPKRAIAAPYKWPTYGTAERVAVGENAAVGSIDFAMYFWSKSDIHRKTALNPGYREVGVAAIPYKSGYLFIVDFGSRPNVLPAFISPKEQALYLTNEQYRYKNGGDWVQSAKQIELLDQNDSPLHSEPELWQQKLTMDKAWSNTFKVLYIDGKVRNSVAVSLADDMVILPDTLALLSGNATSDAAPAATEIPATQASTPQPEQDTTQATAQPTTQSTVQPTNTPTVVPTKSAAAVSPSAQSDLVVYYDSVSLTLVNGAKRPVDLSLVNFKYGDKYLGADRWGKLIPAPIKAFPVGQCMQLLGVAERPIQPEICSAVRSILQFPPDRLFWTQADFEVMNGSQVLATCKMGAGRCDVAWPPVN